MLILQDSLPGINTFFKGIQARDSVRWMLIRMMISILIRHGRNSSMNAASVIQEKPRHRAQPSRFLQRRRWRAMNVLGQLVMKLLKQESWAGEFILILDSTMVGQQGQTIENTYSTGYRKRRKKKGRRYNNYKYARRSCHCFVFGLLLTPKGLRVPFYKPYYTREYAKLKNVTFRTQAQLAAQIIHELPAPRGTSVTVLGDTAFDAKIVRQACGRRNYTWIFPCNANRVFSGPRGKRPRVSSRISQLSSQRFAAIRLTPTRGKHANQRRLSQHRVGSKSKSRTYYVHSEKREVHSVGQVRLVFSSAKPIKKKATRDTTKMLMTNALNLSPRQVVELYCLRWQIELFFKELKSDLGMHQYKYRRFDAVEGWIEIVLITFVYLEWTRKRKLADKRINSEVRRKWQHQRTYGIRQAVLIGIQIRQHKWIAKRLESKSGLKTLAKTFTRQLPYEYRCAA
jgi:hypothetical protein